MGVGEVDDLTDCLSVCKNTQNCISLCCLYLIFTILLSIRKQIKLLNYRLIDDLVDMSYPLLLMK